MLLPAPLLPASAPVASAEWPVGVEIVGDAIPAPLGGKLGEAARGRRIVTDRRKGLCLLCHSGPFPDERFQGDLAPSLAGAGSRWNEGQLRLRVGFAPHLNRASLMPAYAAPPPGLSRVGAAHREQAILSAQEIEDVVAFLSTLRD